MKSLTWEQIKNLLVGAFEGGSNYWYRIDGELLAPGLTHADFGEGGKMQGENYFHWSQLIPVTNGCALLVAAPEGFPTEIPVVLNKLALRHGMEVMREKYPRHFGNVLCENDDAETADVFLQCALFGEVVFG